MGLRERIAERFVPSYRGMRARAAAFDVAWREMPQLFSPEMLAEQMDSELLDVIMQQRGYEDLLGQQGAERDWDDPTRRDYLLRRSRWMYRENAVVRAAVNMWTSFGFGQHVRVRCKDRDVQPTWDAFWTARSNAPIIGETVLQKLSTRLLVDGEVFLVYFVSKVDGSVKVRRLEPEQVTRLITLPDDPDIIVYYERTSTSIDKNEPRLRWYRDWRATDDEVRSVTVPPDVVLASDENKATDVLAQGIIASGLGRRGEPMMATGLPWAQAYKEFLEDRRSLAHAIVTMLDDVKVKGGSRAVDLVRSYLASTLATNASGIETNPPPAAGSSFVHNEGIEITRRPLDTGANSAQTDGMLILGQAAMGLGGIPPMWLGRTDTAQNRSVAEVSIMPTLRVWDWYQILWSSVFSDMAEIVLESAEAYPTPHNIGDTTEVFITLDRPLDVELGAMVTALKDLLTLKVVDNRLALRILLRLREFGITDPEAELERLAPEEKPEPNVVKVEPLAANARLAQATGILHDLFEQMQTGPDAENAARVALEIIAENGNGSH